MSDADLLARITTNANIFGGKPTIRGRRLAVEHVLSMLSAGDTADDVLAAYPFLEAEDVEACVLWALLNAEAPEDDFDRKIAATAHLLSSHAKQAMKEHRDGHTRE